LVKKISRKLQLKKPRKRSQRARSWNVRNTGQKRKTGGNNLKMRGVFFVRTHKARFWQRGGCRRLQRIPKNQGKGRLGGVPRWVGPGRKKLVKRKGGGGVASWGQRDQKQALLYKKQRKKSPEKLGQNKPEKPLSITVQKLGKKRKTRKRPKKLLDPNVLMEEKKLSAHRRRRFNEEERGEKKGKVSINVHSPRGYVRWLGKGTNIRGGGQGVP